MMKNLMLTLMAVFGAFGFVVAQTKTDNSTFFNTKIDYALQAFFSIGGSSPIGFPPEIREIKAYNPSLQLGLEAHATKWLDAEDDWGLRIGISVEGKGMKTTAGVKNYHTQIIQNNQGVKGYFTGKVSTNVRNAYLTIPVSAVYNISNPWNLHAGLFVSFLLDGQFDGYVKDGYFRQGKPTAPKITFEGDSKAAYDFSKKERKFQWGAQIGAERLISQHLAIQSDFSFGITDIFKKDFNAITFNMHNLYLDLGFSYRF